MKALFCTLILCISVYEIVCPPVAPNPQPVEGDSPDEDDVGFGLEYDRYLREVVMALEEDETFRKKLEEMNVTDIKNGKIAMHLDLVSHQIRERLDEIKRQEIQRLRQLARQKMNRMNGMEVLDQIQLRGLERNDRMYPHHVDVKNPHSFEMKDLENLIKKATTDLDEIDKKRKNEFKTYEMEKEHLRKQELERLSEEDRKKKEEEFVELKKRHEQHPPVHHPGSKAQLEDVWEKSDKMDPEDFDPKTFFKMHDLTGDGFLDQDEVEALFQKELDQVYDPNMPEDDLRERYEEMSRMREHVFGELDVDKDRLISLDEFLNYTASQEFQKDPGWETVDEQQQYTDEEFQRYEEMLRQHEADMRSKGLDPNMHQPGMVPVPHDPNVPQMEMPHGQPGFNQQQQQHQDQQALHFQQQQQHQQQQFHQQQQQMGQMPGHGQAPPAQMPGHVGQGQMGQMAGQGQMGQMPQMAQGVPQNQFQGQHQQQMNIQQQQQPVQAQQHQQQQQQQQHGIPQQPKQPIQAQHQQGIPQQQQQQQPGHAQQQQQGIPQHQQGLPQQNKPMV